MHQNKNSMKLNNPFVTNGYAGAEYFCDREVETKQITELLTNENNIALISPRRIGKTELIHHCFAQPEIKDKYYTFVIDIYSTNSVSDLVNMFGKAIIDEIFAYLNNADKPCLVAIDEFQQIINYGDKRMEALLRTYVQRSVNAHFIFSGSHRHLMGEIFTSPARPFYQSVVLMNLKPLSLDKYREFAIDKFEERGKTLDPQVADEVYSRFDGITSYMQRIMNVLFLKTQEGSTCTTAMIDDAIDYNIDIASDTYEAMLRQMPEKQRAVFIAISAEGTAKNVRSGAFAKKYHLPSPSSVNSAIKGLLDKDFITHSGDAYVVYDKFFDLWIQRNVIR